MRAKDIKGIPVSIRAVSHQDNRVLGTTAGVGGHSLVVKNGKRSDLFHPSCVVGYSSTEVWIDGRCTFTGSAYRDTGFYVGDKVFDSDGVKVGKIIKITYYPDILVLSRWLWFRLRERKVFPLGRLSIPITEAQRVDRTAKTVRLEHTLRHITGTCCGNKPP